MYTFLCFLVIIASASLLFLDGYKRFSVLLVGLTFFPYGIYLLPHLNAQRIMIFGFIFSVFLRPSEWRKIRSIPSFWLLILLLGSFIATAMTDKRVGFFDGTYKAVIAYCESFGCIFIGYLSIQKDKDVGRVFNLIRKLAYVVCAYSIFCFLIGYDFYNQLIPGTDSMIGGRLRIASLYYNSHVAGFAISVMALILLFQDTVKNKQPFKDPVIYLLVLSLFFTGSRSSLLDFLVGCLLLYIPTFMESKHKVRFLFVSIILIGIICFIIGGYVMSSFSDAFKEGGGDTGGSSWEMRQQQLYYSLWLYHKSPIFGNGINYFWEVIKAKGGYLSSMLLGAESYVFILLIDRGLIEIILNILYFGSTYLSFLRYKEQQKFLGLAILTAFLVNSISEGNEYKWVFVLPFIGMMFKDIHIRNSYKAK